MRSEVGTSSAESGGWGAPDKSQIVKITVSAETRKKLGDRTVQRKCSWDVCVPVPHMHQNPCHRDTEDNEEPGPAMHTHTHVHIHIYTCTHTHVYTHPHTHTVVSFILFIEHDQYFSTIKNNNNRNSQMEYSQLTGGTLFVSHAEEFTSRALGF